MCIFCKSSNYHLLFEIYFTASNKRKMKFTPWCFSRAVISDILNMLFDYTIPSLYESSEKFQHISFLFEHTCLLLSIVIAVLRLLGNFPETKKGQFNWNDIFLLKILGVLVLKLANVANFAPMFCKLKLKSSYVRSIVIFQLRF